MFLKINRAKNFDVFYCEASKFFLFVKGFYEFGFLYNRSFNRFQRFYDARVVWSFETQNDRALAGDFDKLGTRVFRIRFSSSRKPHRLKCPVRHAIKNFAGMYHARRFFGDRVFYVQRNAEME